MFEWGIQSFTVSGGEEVHVERASTLIIVGPNSSGKSRALREIEILLYPQKHVLYPESRVIQSIQTFSEGSEKDFRCWLEQHYSYPIGGHIGLASRGVVVSAGQASDLWKGLTEGSAVQNARRFVCEMLDAGSRLEVGKAKKSIFYYRNCPHEYIHLLQLRDSLLKQISEELYKAFGLDLLINWGGGPEVWFHVGKEPARTPDRDRVSVEYLEELNRLPRLELAGDGIRSFVATLLATMCGAQPILLVDEPEAYLHPPQIRRLAAILVRSAETMKRQVVIATHSSDVIRGALNESDRVAVCRLVREESLNHAAVLERAKVKQLLSTPLLRSAAAIDGVFHSGVVVCESESDARIYEALVGQLEGQKIIDGPADIYFVHGAGKGELAPLTSAYTNLKVPVAVISDFDLLQKQGEFEKVFSALGGSFNAVRSLYTITSSALNNLPPLKPTTEFLREAQEVLDEMQRLSTLSAKTDGVQSDLMLEQRRKLSKLLTDSRDWSEAKKYGITMLKGGAHSSCKQLLDKCKSLGLFIVPIGSLESWWREGPAKKEGWFQQAIEEISLHPSSFHEASDFTLEVCQYLSIGLKPRN